nr:MAG TPA: hypothetical protein [Caudoviricetes sp.]
MVVRTEKEKREIIKWLNWCFKCHERLAGLLTPDDFNRVGEVLTYNIYAIKDMKNAESAELASKCSKEALIREIMEGNDGTEE